MKKEDVIDILKEMLDDALHCSCDNGKCSICDLHFDMVKEAVALQYAILYLEKVE